MFERLRRLMPSHESVASNRWLKWLGPSVLHPRLFHLSRRGVAAGRGQGVERRRERGEQRRAGLALREIGSTGPPRTRTTTTRTVAPRPPPPLRCRY